MTTTISFAGKVCDNKLSKQAVNSLAFVPRYIDTKTEKFIGERFGGVAVDARRLKLSESLRQLQARRLHPWHDQRLSSERRAPWRRRTQDRAYRNEAHRGLRRSCHLKGKAFLSMVCPVPASHTAQSPSSPARQV